MNVAAFAALLLATTLLSFRSGGAPERWTAGIFAAGGIATVLTYSATARRFATVEAYVAAVDILVLAGLLLVLVRADRFWPFATFAAQGVAVLVHVIKLIDPLILRKAYAIALAVPSWLTLVALLAGLARHARRVRADGPELDWSW